MNKIEIENFSGNRFKGWVRSNIDYDIPHLSGKATSMDFVVGRRTGIDTKIIDVKVDLLPGQRITVNLDNAYSAPVTISPLPSNLEAFFGGGLTLAGVPMSLKGDIVVDGAAIAAEFECRVGRMFHARLFLTYYPDQNFLIRGELVVTCSNPNVQDMGETIPPNFDLRFGDALTLIPGRSFRFDPIDSGTFFGDGQARILPVFFVWPRHVKNNEEWGHVSTLSNLLIGSVGIRKLLLNGNPRYPSNFSAKAWAKNLFPESIRRLHTWESGIIGPNKNSGNTGTQEDQAFVRGEAMFPDGAGAAIVTYLAGLKLSSRPCHHLEHDGRQVTYALHPNLVFWDGRPHWNILVSTDRLGKPPNAVVNESVFNGWWGPDVEHWFMNTPIAAARLTGSKAMQWLLSMQAKIYELQWTHRAGLYNSSPFASRAVGWEGIMAVHLHRNLEDRILAERVADNWRQRATKIMLPTFANEPEGIWDYRLDSGFGTGWRWAGWQHSIGVYGLDLALCYFLPESSKVECQRTALACLNHNWIKRSFESFYRGATNMIYTHNGKSLTDPYVPVSQSYYDSLNPWPQPDWFMSTWDIPALAVVQKYFPNNPKLIEVLTQIRNMNLTEFKWFPPELILP